MGRIIIFAAVCAAAYWYMKRQVRKLDRRSGRYGRTGRCKTPPPITDELVKDPVCGIYCPKRESVQMYHKGKRYYFCSKECKRKFIDKAAG